MKPGVGVAEERGPPGEEGGFNEGKPAVGVFAGEAPGGGGVCPEEGADFLMFRQVGPGVLGVRWGAGVKAEEDFIELSGEL